MGKVLQELGELLPFLVHHRTSAALVCPDGPSRHSDGATPQSTIEGCLNATISVQSPCGGVCRDSSRLVLLAPWLSCVSTHTLATSGFLQATLGSRVGSLNSSFPRGNSLHRAASLPQTHELHSPAAPPGLPLWLFIRMRDPFSGPGIPPRPLRERATGWTRLITDDILPATSTASSSGLAQRTAPTAPQCPSPAGSGPTD